TDADIYAERYVISNNNIPISPTRILVNIDTNFEDGASVAMGPGGKFDIVYARQFMPNSLDWDIYGSQYSSTGVLLHDGVHINDAGNTGLFPSVSMENNGNAVVAYEEFVGGDWGIYANRWSGPPAGPRITVQNASGINEFIPSVALEPVGGRFIVAYDTDIG